MVHPALLPLMRTPRLPVLFTLPRNMVHRALLPLMRTPRLPVVDWTDAPADLNGFVFRRKTKSGFCACAITFQTQSNTAFLLQKCLPERASTLRYTLNACPAFRSHIDCSAYCVYKPVSVITKLQKKLLEMLCSALWRRHALLTLLYDTRCWQCLQNDAYHVVIYCLFHGTVSV